MDTNIIQIIKFSWISYPILGAFFTIFGLFWYQHFYKHKITNFKRIKNINQPFISIFVPAHNEQHSLKRVISYLATKLNYTNYEIIIIDDGSTDKTLKIAKNLQRKYHQTKKIRIIHIENNNGKAHAFNVALGFANGSLILSNDADTIPEKDALNKYVNYFIGSKNKNVGAVTANMNVYNPSNAISKTQIVEFSSIIGGIKRTQSAIAGSMYALNGANTMYRKDALIDVGGFRQNRATEDISVAWDLNFYHWQTEFSPEILFYMIVPENVKNLYRQRKRWAQGGTEVWLANLKRILFFPIIIHKQIPIYIENTVSLIWSFLYFISMISIISISGYYLFNGDYHQLYMTWLVNSILICIEYTVGFIQLVLSLHYDEDGIKMKYLIFAPIYICFLWILNPLTILVTFIKAIETIFKGRYSGTWISPR